MGAPAPSAPMLPMPVDWDRETRKAIDREDHGHRIQADHDSHSCCEPTLALSPIPLHNRCACTCCQF